MPRLIRKTERDLRVQNKINFVIEIYAGIFEAEKSNLINVKNFKLDLNITIDEMSLIKANRKIVEQIKLFNNIYAMYPQNQELINITQRLKQVEAEISKILKEEFRIAKGLRSRLRETEL